MNKYYVYSKLLDHLSLYIKTSTADKFRFWKTWKKHLIIWTRERDIRGK